MNERTWTWDAPIHYHRCPECHWISESRKTWEYSKGMYILQLECPKCQRRFKKQKSAIQTFRPFIGHPKPSDVEWD